MNFQKTKETLDNLYNDLLAQHQSAQGAMEKEHYKRASQILALALGEADRELTVANKELLLSEPELAEDKVFRSEAEAARVRVTQEIEKLKSIKAVCDSMYSNDAFVEEKKKLIIKINWLWSRERLYSNMNVAMLN